MLWFVTAAAALQPGTSPVTLRRNTANALPPELRPGGAKFTTVAWDRSVQLNLVIQAKYVLTVVQCREDALAAVAQGHATPGYHPANQSRPPGAVVAQRRVYASPMAADVNLENTKSGRPPRPCYPDVCFAVDNFEDAFQDMILSRPGDCYCVMLHVHASRQGPPAATATTSGVPPPPPSTPSAASSTPASPATSATERRATLFSAYVTREQVAQYVATRAAENPKPSLLLRLLTGLRGGGGAGRQERVVMRGPGGVGRAEAVATPVQQDEEEEEPRAAGAPGQPALQLSLMWMSLQVSALAQAVLQFACEGL